MPARPAPGRRFFELDSLMAWLKKIFKRRESPDRLIFQGDFGSWQQAEAEARGYGDISILVKTEESMREILAGKAVYERDSVLLPKPEYPWPLIGCLLSAALAAGGRLTVLDFGGALGSTYYQCRPFLTNVPQLAWMVVEQKHYVESGLREFSKEPVTFHDTVAAAYSARKPDLALLSSVLPYLPDPYSLFQEMLCLKIQHVVVDRTFFLRRPAERLTVQIVPKSVYPATYPAWFLNEAKLRAIAARAGYRLVAEFQALDQNEPEGENADAKGFFWRLGA